MEYFYCRMRFSATIYNNNWVCADNSAPCGHSASADTCLRPEREAERKKSLIVLQLGLSEPQGLGQKPFNEEMSLLKTSLWWKVLGFLSWSFRKVSSSCKKTVYIITQDYYWWLKNVTKCTKTYKNEPFSWCKVFIDKFKAAVVERAVHTTLLLLL